MGETEPSSTSSSNDDVLRSRAASPPPASSCSSHVTYRWTHACDRYPSSNQSEDQEQQSELLQSQHSDGSTRVRFDYQDEETRTRICKNAQDLVDGLQRDRDSTTVNARVARKALRYRRLLDKFSDLDPQSARVDISAFLGIEWRRVDMNGSPSASSQSSNSSPPSEETDGSKDDAL